MMTYFTLCTHSEHAIQYSLCLSGSAIQSSIHHSFNKQTEKKKKKKIVDVTTLYPEHHYGSKFGNKIHQINQKENVFYFYMYDI